jgi:uncharacterized protein YceK
VNPSCVVLAALAAISVAGCASVEQRQSDESKADKTYVTGSRIPARDGSTSTRVTAIENKVDIQDIGARSGIAAGGPKGIGQ